MPCGRAVREKAYNPENRNVPDRFVSDARRHIIDRFVYTHRKSHSIEFAPYYSLSPVSLGVYVDVWVAMPRGGSRAALGPEGPRKPNLKTHTDNWG